MRYPGAGQYSVRTITDQGAERLEILRNGKSFRGRRLVFDEHKALGLLLCFDQIQAYATGRLLPLHEAMTHRVSGRLFTIERFRLEAGGDLTDYLRITEEGPYGWSMAFGRSKAAGLLTVRPEVESWLKQSSGFVQDAALVPLRPAPLVVPAGHAWTWQITRPGRVRANLGSLQGEFFSSRSEIECVSVMGESIGRLSKGDDEWQLDLEVVASPAGASLLVLATPDDRCVVGIAVGKRAVAYLR